MNSLGLKIGFLCVAWLSWLNVISAQICNRPYDPCFSLIPESQVVAVLAANTNSVLFDASFCDGGFAADYGNGDGSAPLAELRFM